MLLWMNLQLSHHNNMISHQQNYPLMEVLLIYSVIIWWVFYWVFSLIHSLFILYLIWICSFFKGGLINYIWLKIQLYTCQFLNIYFFYFFLIFIYPWYFIHFRFYHASILFYFTFFCLVLLFKTPNITEEYFIELE